MVLSFKEGRKNTLSGLPYAGSQEIQAQPRPKEKPITPRNLSKPRMANWDRRPAHFQSQGSGGEKGLLTYVHCGGNDVGRKGRTVK